MSTPPSAESLPHHNDANSNNAPDAASADTSSKKYDGAANNSHTKNILLADPNADVPISSDDDDDDHGIEEGENNEVAASPGMKDRRRLTTEIFAAHGGIRLNWSHITYKVQIPNPDDDNKLTKTKVIMDNLSGNLLPGRVLAIMGPSGSSKSTLSNAITARLARDITNSSLDGIVYLNDVVFEERHKPIVAFVSQDDIVMPKETPLDAFRFSAGIRNEELSTEEIEVRTQDMIRELKLNSCKDTIMGVPGILKGLSGGEKRRTNIGVELINNPPVIILDEPTSGLDSVAAYRVGKLIRSLAHKEGRTVACTIHSPSSELFALFDDVLLLAKGQTVYHGPANGLRDYFDCIGRPMPENINPVEFAMKLLQSKGSELQQYIEAWKRCAEIAVPGIYARYNTYGVDSFEEDQQKKNLAAIAAAGNEGQEMHDKNKTVVKVTSVESQDEYSSGEELPPIKNPMDSLFHERHGAGVARCLAPPPEAIKPTNEVIDKLLDMRKPPSLLHQLRLLTGRSWRNVVRDPMLTIGRIMQVLIFAIFIGLLFWGLKTNTNGVQDRQGVFFLLLIQNVFLSMMPALMAFPPELAVFLQDQANGMYGPIAFYWAKTIVELPINTLAPTLFGTIIYCMSQLTLKAENYFSFLAITLANAYCANALGMFLGAFSGRKPEAAFVFAPLIVMPLAFVAGLFANTERLEPGWVWLEWVSFPRYVYKAYIRIEFVDFGVICSKATDSGCRYPTGMDVVRFLGFDQYEFDKWGYDLIMIFVVQIVFRFLGMAGLYYQSMAQHAHLVYGDNHKRISKISAEAEEKEQQQQQKQLQE